jgi:cobalt-zinc-cadmium efflux system outer membrane protein
MSDLKNAHIRKWDRTKVATAVLAVTAAFTSSIRGQGGSTLTEREVVSVALQENQTVKAARAKWLAMKKRVPQAKAWDDPMVGVDIERHGTTTFTTFSDNEWMASQAVPLSGKNLARGRAAVAEAIFAFEELRRIELDVVSRTKAAFARLAGAYGQLEINSRNQELLKQFTEISRAKYESGTQSQSDVLLAQTDLARLGETQAQFEREVSDQQTQLNVLMNRPASSHLGRPQGFGFTSVFWPRQTLEAYALSNRPEIGMAQRKIEAEKARVQLAQRQWIPDPRLRVEARQFKEPSGFQEYDTGIFFEVPWVNYRKYSAGVAEAKSSLEAAQREYGATQTEVLGLVRDQLKKIETAAHNYELFHDNIAPLAKQAVDVTRASYEVDKTSFLELITAQRTLQNVESSQLQHLVEHEVAVAELDAIVGRTLPQIQEGASK